MTRNPEVDCCERAISLSHSGFAPAAILNPENLFLWFLRKNLHHFSILPRCLIDRLKDDLRVGGVKS